MTEYTAAAVSPQPDYIALAIVAALIAIVVAMVIRKHSANKKKATQADAVNVTVTAVEETAAKTTGTSDEMSSPEAPGSAGKLKIYDVDPKTVAMLMAIVANEMGKPLNELRFISIKEVK